MSEQLLGDSERLDLEAIEARLDGTEERRESDV